MLKKIFLAWFPFACLMTLFALLAYVLVQQDLRQSANDPQIQMAEDNISPASLPAIDISQSLAPFVIIFDDNGKPIASSGTLNGATPVPPAGVFDYVRTSGGGNLRPTDVFGEDRFTWEPESGVRVAAVVVRQGSDFILAGRNIREVERREDRAVLTTLAAWLVGVVGLFVVEVLICVAA